MNFETKPAKDVQRPNRSNNNLTAALAELPVGLALFVPQENDRTVAQTQMYARMVALRTRPGQKVSVAQDKAKGGAWVWYIEAQS